MERVEPQRSGLAVAARHEACWSARLQSGTRKRRDTPLPTQKALGTDAARESRELGVGTLRRNRSAKWLRVPPHVVTRGAESCLFLLIFIPNRVLYLF